MAKDRRKLQHIHSSIEDRQPTPATLEVGEIAVNNADKKEFLSIKSSQNKVVRFSSDEQMVTWMEKKEVIPYSAATRGSSGGTGGPNSVTNNDLLQNKSNIVVLFNQVASKNTPHYNDINDGKDIYNREVNPNHDGTLSYGAGIAIDMSRYAMIGANPSFSSLTVTDETNLSGNTTISDGDRTGTRTGNTFTINVTNKNENVSARTSTIGTDALTVIGNSATKVSGNTAISTNGTTTITSTGNTSIVTNGENKRITINSSGTGGDVRIYANDVLTATANTIVVSGTTSISAKTPTTYISGTTLEVNETNINISANTGTNISGGTFSNTTTDDTTFNAGGNTTITSTGNTSIVTNGVNNKVTINSSGNGGDVEISAKDGVTTSANTVVASGTTSVSINTPTTNISGTTTNITGATNIKGATTISGSSLSVTGATNIKGNVCVTGTVTASQAIYSSDRDLKENIEEVDLDALNKAGWISTKSYNFKGETNKLYGVIAQEVQEAGLDELVYTKDDGHLAVDYTSLMMLKIASLEKLCEDLLKRTLSLEEEVKFLRENNK